MEDRALYHAILAAPHDDAPRLVYADWLDDRAATEPDPPARRLRARAELIRVQVALARSGPGGWKRDNPRPLELVARERRLLFRAGRKVRGEVPVGMASAPFDRGFLRPLRALRPHEFLSPLEDVSRPWMARFPYRSRLPELLPDGADPWNAAPLWDVHLFASTWAHDPEADTGQYGPALDEAGQSARMERVGWLKVSFARTPVLNFLRYGKFPNVETLVLNSGPFPAVLRAVSANESFRSLRYVQFGDDQWLWVRSHEERERFRFAEKVISEANGTEPAFGVMRTALAGIVQTVPRLLLPPPPPPPPLPPPPPPPVLLQLPTWAQLKTPTSAREQDIEAVKYFLSFAFLFLLAGVGWLVRQPASEQKPAPRPVPAVKSNTDLDKHKIPNEAIEAAKQLQKPTQPK